VRRIVIALVIFVVGLTVLWHGANRWMATPLTAGIDRRTGYLTQPASIGVIRRTISATGALKARSTVDVSSQLSGQIASVGVDFNDIVTRGQTLAELDRRGFEAHVSQARAEAAMARDNIAILSTRRDRGQRNLDESIAERQVFAARVDKARATAVAAAARRGRAEKLQPQGATTMSSLEEARAAHETAQAGLREAEGDAAAHEQKIGSLEAAFREAQAELVNANAALPLRDAAVDLAELDLERSAIRSPIDGVVVKRAVEPGQTVAASLDSPVLFTIAGELAKMEIHANIDETDVGEIVAGQQAVFSVTAFPGRTFPARVTKIRKSGQIVQGVVTYTVVLETDNADGRLLPGMTSTLRIVVEEVGPVLSLPLAALRFTPDGQAAVDGRVWVLAQDGGIEPRDLVFGPDDRQQIAVREGRLAEGEAIILSRPRPADTGRFLGIRF